MQGPHLFPTANQSSRQFRAFFFFFFPDSVFPSLTLIIPWARFVSVWAGPELLYTSVYPFQRMERTMGFPQLVSQQYRVQQWLTNEEVLKKACVYVFVCLFIFFFSNYVVSSSVILRHQHRWRAEEKVLFYFFVCLKKKKKEELISLFSSYISKSKIILFLLILFLGKWV